MPLAGDPIYGDVVSSIFDHFVLSKVTCHPHNRGRKGLLILFV